MSSRTRTVVGVLALGALIGGFWYLLLAPKRADVSAVDDQIAQAEKRRDAARASAAQAEQARSRYLRDYATVARLGKAVPADDDVASLLYQLETIARANGIDFRSVKLTGAASATPAAAPAKTAAADEPGQESEKEPEEQGDDTAAAPAAPVVAQPPPGAVVGPAGLLTVPFSFQFDGDYLKLQRLLKTINGLADNEGRRITVQGRLLTVDGFSLTPSMKGLPKLKAIVNATAYIVPPADATDAAAKPQGPAGATGSETTTALTTADAQGAGR